METRKRRLLCRTAEVALIVFGVLAVPGLASAGDDYITNTQTGQSIIPGATDIGNHCDDCVTPLPLPFQVPVYSTPYSSAYVSSNGNIQFLTANGGAPPSACMPLAISGLDRAFIPYFGDLRTDETGGGIFTAVVGSPPNRQFVIEWRTTYFQRSGSANFEVVLTEGSGTLSVIYGANTDNGSMETSGIQSSDLGSFTQFSCGESTLVSGLRVNYVPAGGPPPPPPLRHRRHRRRLHRHHRLRHRHHHRRHRHRLRHRLRHRHRHRLRHLRPAAACRGCIGLQARQREAADPQGQLLRRPRPPRSHQAIAARPRHRAEPEARRRQAQGLPGQPAGRAQVAAPSGR